MLGVGLIAVSLVSFCLIPTGPISLGMDGSGAFLLNYLFVVAYFIFLLVEGRLKRGRDGLAPLFLLLVLSLISAYALNREMSVFERSTGWWVVVLVIGCANYFTVPFFHRLPTGMQQIVCGIAGVSFTAFAYLSVYLIPLYGISACLSFFLGISLHSFVPLLFVIYTIVFMRKAAWEKRKLWIGFFTGLGLSLVITVGFAFQWHSIVRDMNRNYSRANDEHNPDLPAWVYAAQRSPQGPVTEKILKTGLVYTVYNNHWGFWDGMPHVDFGEAKKHDPLVIIATMLSEESVLTDEDKIKMLESLYDSRHQAQERLWRGDDLYTSRVHTQVELWPRLHLSYTEKDITIVNRAMKSFWRNQQEAIYTFHLPEGAVVSRLSLWVNGREEKARLATREKADSAYHTVVGVESRDPSVVHWQEGNTVLVRVFPVLAGESRRFTIGVTAPLAVDGLAGGGTTAIGGGEKASGGELVYRNIYFDGPSPAGASEAVAIRPQQPLSHLWLPGFFPEGSGGGAGSKGKVIGREGVYQADWAIRFRDEGVDASSFSFNGQQYAMQPYKVEREAAEFGEVYLDVNKSWDREEFETIYQWVRNKKVYVYSPVSGLEAVNDQNRDELFRELAGEEFSLFPLTAVADSSSALLISKSPPSSPTLADLGQCPFSNQLHTHFLKGQKIRYFNLGNELSPYWKALKECGAFRYEHGNAEDLHVLLTKGEFAKDAENEEQIVLDEAGMVIRRKEAAGAEALEAAGANMTGGKPALNGGPENPAGQQQAPDHLLRLFAYHHILQKIGGRLPGERPGDDPAPEESLVSEAKEAGIVTPVSSLVVLETQNDYQRFNIEDSKNSLKNAGLQGKGSVPEPGEWMLLILVVLLFLYIRLQSSRLRAKTGRP